MKHISRFLSLMLVLLLLCGSALAEIPTWLHVDQLPLTDEPVKLKIACLVHNNSTDPLNSWTYEYIKQVMGVDIDLEYFYSASRNETIVMMMADGTLPDMIIACSLNANELTKYGTVEGKLLDLRPYINEENAPNLTAIYAEHPEYLNELVTPDGAQYSIGYINENSFGTTCFNMFYNYDWLEACGLSVPTTLDEFLEMLRAFKKYGEEQGIDGIAPFGGNSGAFNCTYLILNALGYDTSINYQWRGSCDTNICLRNGKIVMPAYDREVLPYYLNYLHTMYEEKLMEEDYYTLDIDTCKAHLAANRYGVFNIMPSIYTNIEQGRSWSGIIPMTSEYSDKAFWPNYSMQTIGAFVVSADTKYPELCVAFADHFYDPEYCQMFLNGYTGPSVNQPELFLGKTTGWYYDPINGITNDDYLAIKEKYQSYIFWRYDKLFLWGPGLFGVTRSEGPGVTHDENGNKFSAYEVEGKGETIMEKAKIRENTTIATQQQGIALYNCQSKYLIDEYTPTVCYFDEETTERIDELKTLVTEYATKELAKFVIGTRPLSELDDYFAEMDKLGAAEYVQYYADYYASMH